MIKSEKNKKRAFYNKILLFISLFLLVAAIVTLLIKPIQDYFRNKELEKLVLTLEKEVLSNADIEKKNIQNDENSDENFSIPTMTFIVDKDKMIVPGEEVEGFADEEYDIDAILENIPPQVTLTALGTIQIPSIELHIPLLNQAGVIDLRYGAGMLSGTANPGTAGNMVILGHNMRARGSIFNRLHEVQMGDEIRVTLLDKMTYTYIVDEIVSPLEPENLPDYIGIDSGSGKQITLVTCTNENGSHRRLVIGHLQ